MADVVRFSCCEHTKSQYWCPACHLGFCSGYHFDRHLHESGHPPPSSYEPFFTPPWPKVPS